MNVAEGRTEEEMEGKTWARGMERKRKEREKLCLENRWKVTASRHVISMYVS